MEDDNFQRSVILLVEHGPQGSMGFILNRQLKYVLADIIEDLPGQHTPVFLGGPVDPNSLHYVHRLGHLIPESREVMDGLYWGGDFDTVRKLIVSKSVQEEDILFFVGYSGWGPGQLQNELRRKSWIIAPENTEFVFQEDHQHLWQSLLRSMGTKYQIISNYPTDPMLN